MKIEVKKLSNFDNEIELPKYAYDGDSGMDIRACLPEELRKTGIDVGFSGGNRCAIPTGLAFSVPKGYELQVRPRSGLTLKTTVSVANSPGTIDSNFTGEVKIIVDAKFRDTIIKHGDKIAQLVLCPVIKADLEVVNEFTKETVRGDKGFGSSGVTL